MRRSSVQFRVSACLFDRGVSAGLLPGLRIEFWRNGVRLGVLKCPEGVGGVFLVFSMAIVV